MTFGWTQASSFAIGAKVGRGHAQTPRHQSSTIASTQHAFTAAGDTEPIVKDAIDAVGGGISASSSSVKGTSIVLVGGGPQLRGIKKQLEASLTALGVDKLEEFYLHQPDPDADLLESLKCVDGRVREGIVNVIGLSNYHASEVARAFSLCAEHGLT